MERRVATMCLAMAMCLSVAFISYAGEWKQDTTGWKYQDENNSYPANQWKEIGGKQYYFNENGYCLQNATTPDGYTVGPDGALIGEVYRENPFGSPISVSHELGQEQTIKILTYDPLYGYTRVTYNINDGDKKSMNRMISSLKAVVNSESTESGSLYDSIYASDGREEAFKDFYRRTNNAIGALKYMEDTYGKESPEFIEIFQKYNDIISSQEYMKIKDENKDLFEKYQPNHNTTPPQSKGGFGGEAHGNIHYNGSGEAWLRG